MHGTDHPGMYGGKSTRTASPNGCGIYYASTAYMSCLRERILAGDGAFQAAQEAYLGQKVFSMEGNCYKRPRYGHRSPRGEQLWLERRGHQLYADSHDFPLLFSPQLPEKLAQDMRLLFPVYRFLESTAQEVLRPRDGAGALAEVTEVPSLAKAGAGFFFRKNSDRFYGDATLPQVTVRFPFENLKKHASVLRFREIYSTMSPSCYMNCMGTEKWRKGICYPSAA